MKEDVLEEIRRRVESGYKGELTYNYRTGIYEVTTYKPLVPDMDLKTHKIPRGTYDQLELVEAVYGKQ